MAKHHLLLLLFVLLVACSDHNDVAKDKSGNETVFDSQINALEKAKSVDQQVQDAADKARKSIEDSGG